MDVASLVAQHQERGNIFSGNKLFVLGCVAIREERKMKLLLEEVVVGSALVWVIILLVIMLRSATKADATKPLVLQYVELLKQHKQPGGPNAPEVRAFVAQHENDKEFMARVEALNETLTP